MFADKHKVIGILGGMGPQATVDFYQQILRLTTEIVGVEVEQDHISSVIFSNPKIPDRAASHSDSGRIALERYLIDSAKVLEQSGVDVIAMPCNSAHIAYQQLNRATPLPVLNMVAITAEYLSQAGHQRVLLLGASATYHSDLYQQQLNRFEIEVICPTARQKTQLMEIIQQVKLQRELNEARRELLAIVYGYQLPVILGCTELPLLTEAVDIDRELINPTELLARAAIEFVTQ